MTKEEQLKIYSAYLPYKLEVKVYFDDPDHSRIVTMCAIDTDEIYTYSRKPESWYISGRDEEHNMRGNYGILECMPILYDLSYLTKEIQHEGEVVVLAKKIFKREWQDIAEYYVQCNQIMKLSYDDIQLLLKHHFNVFNLPEGEYINKATLKTK